MRSNVHEKVIPLVPKRYDWLIFKTNIQTPFQVDVLSLLLKEHTDITEWTIDLEDEDHVFRVKATTGLKVEEIISLGGIVGFQIQPL